MVNVFIWNFDGEWVYWCRCQRRCLPLLLDIAKQSNVECDWLGF